MTWCRVQSEIDKLNMDASEKSLELGQIISSVSNILERCEESFRIRHNKPHVERSTDKMTGTLQIYPCMHCILYLRDIHTGMPLTEQFLRTMSKLDEIEMFMIDYRDITMEYYNNYDATGEDKFPSSLYRCDDIEYLPQLAFSVQYHL